MNVIIIVKLILAHVLTDFVFQPTSWVEKKQEKILKTYHFWIHITIAAVLSYLFVADWSNWIIPTIIFITHGGIDALKLYLERKSLKEIKNIESTITINQVEQTEAEKTEQNEKNEKITKQERKLTQLFLYDQLAHLVVILIIGLFVNHNLNSVKNWITEIIKTSDDLVIVITTIVLVMSPTGIIIGKITESFRKQFDTKDSLQKAGKFIGTFERILVLIFVFNGQYDAIGYLLASKSILRITIDSDEEGRKKTEYVLVGTLISFLSAITISLLALYLINHN
jgi:p-aminobenzoyl-glutamate transporter AbgT